MGGQTDVVRARIISATASLLRQGGREAASTRAVSAAAGVQAPTLYRQFGDLQGLLDAVARETFLTYVREKATLSESTDPVDDLRRGWDLHLAFGLANPAVYMLIHSHRTAGTPSAAAQEGQAVLHRLVTRTAQAGQLRVSVAHAVNLIAAAGEGVTLSLIGCAPDERDPQLSTTMREAVLTTITIPPQGAAVGRAPAAAGLVAHAVALQAELSEGADPLPLSLAEQTLLGEWLNRLATQQPKNAAPEKP